MVSICWTLVSTLAPQNKSGCLLVSGIICHIHHPSPPTRPEISAKIFFSSHFCPSHPKIWCSSPNAFQFVCFSKALDSRKAVFPWGFPPLTLWFCLVSGYIPLRWTRSRWLLPWSLLHLLVHPHLRGLIFWQRIETWVMPPSNQVNCFLRQQQLPPTFSWQGSKARWGLWNFYTALNRSGTLTGTLDHLKMESLT